MERQHAVVGKRLRFARRELEGGEVDHLVAARVELFLRRLSRVGGVKRKEEHAALGAELLLVACIFECHIYMFTDLVFLNN